MARSPYDLRRVGMPVGDDAAASSAAVLVIVLFTVYFTVSMILRPFENHREPPS